MKKYLWVSALLLLFSGCSDSKHNSLMITQESHYPIQETIQRLSRAMEKKGYHVTKTTAHSARAKKEGIYLHPTFSVTLDKPKVFSALLTCNPSLAIDLPIRVVAYSELGGAVKFSYTQPEYWSLKHNIKDKNCIAIVLEIARDFDEAVETLKK